MPKPKLTRGASTDLRFLADAIGWEANSLAGEHSLGMQHQASRNLAFLSELINTVVDLGIEEGEILEGPPIKRGLDHAKLT